ncbi:MAG TPA: hypothetical protein ENK57_21735 [Polyangiaceae bacterium]|nr:hypothetical protein [Polyangiaceae bacterium]
MIRVASFLALVTSIATFVACASDVTSPGSGGGGATGDGGNGQGASGGTGGTGAGPGAGGQGASDPDLTCLQLCPHPGWDCTGVDLENGSGVASDVTSTGCTFTATLATSGTVEMMIDCLDVQACVTASDGSCAGNVGECYPLDVAMDAESFSYMVPNCIQGSLSCSKLYP